MLSTWQSMLYFLATLLHPSYHWLDISLLSTVTLRITVYSIHLSFTYCFPLLNYLMISLLPQQCTSEQPASLHSILKQSFVLSVLVLTFSLPSPRNPSLVFPAKQIFSSSPHSPHCFSTLQARFREPSSLPWSRCCPVICSPSMSTWRSAPVERTPTCIPGTIQVSYAALCRWGMRGNLTDFKGGRGISVAAQD